MSLTATRVAAAPATDPAPDPGRRAARTAFGGAAILAAALLAVVVVSSLATRPTTVGAQVLSGGPSVCLHAGSSTEPLCLSAFHTSHLRLGGAWPGQCLDLTYVGRQVTAGSLTGAWSVACSRSGP